MLVTRCHSQVFVPKQLGHGVNIGAFHPQPTCCSVAQVVKAKIGNILTPAQTGKRKRLPVQG